MENIGKSAIERLIFSDTIPLPPEKRTEKILQLSIAPAFAEAIRRVHGEEPISQMFE